MKIGYLVNLKPDDDLVEELDRAKEMGFDNIQLGLPNTTNLKDKKLVHEIKEAVEASNLHVSEIRARWSGPIVWDLKDGPATLGIVPAVYRDARIKDILEWSDFAEYLGVSVISTHIGFLPMDPYHPDYSGTVIALKHICNSIKKKNQLFYIETGQEHPIGLMRLFSELESTVDNLFINFDPANLLMYGNANPIDALHMLGKHVREVHAKDGRYPVDGWNLGVETKLGEGMVNYPAFIRALRDVGFDGILCIENERTEAIGKAARYKEILESKLYLEQLLSEL